MKKAKGDKNRIKRQEDFDEAEESREFFASSFLVSKVDVVGVVLVSISVVDSVVKISTPKNPLFMMLSNLS